METNQPTAMDNRQPTSLAEINAAVGEQVVELPGFGDGKPFYCRLRRLSLLQLAKTGKIPNPLLPTVMELYQTGKASQGDLKTAAETMELMARESMVEPTYQEIVDAGLMLTDEQLTAIYLYAQRGAAALAPFRQNAIVSDAVPDGANVENAARKLAGNNGWLRGVLPKRGGSMA